ncbi:MAG TPA: ABC transporter permease [Candidatus Nanopelagicaceae bacterium]|nr:ABC transporter permease [Candidatus Nanopelagicaceae bacterium]
MIPEGTAAAAPEAPAASPIGRSLRAQARVELLLLLRQPENLLVILVLPVLLLLFFAEVRAFPSIHGRPINFLVPGILTLALMSTGMVSLGISTAYQRYYRVLKRLGGTPLPRGVLVAAKAASVLLVEVGQVALVLGIAYFGFAWRPPGSLPLAILVMLVGAIMFAAIGLTMAGVMRAELTIGGANGLYLIFLILGGVAMPVQQLPDIVRQLASVLPPTALSASLRAILAGGAFPAAPVALLAGWTLLLLATAIRFFRWE